MSAGSIKTGIWMDHNRTGMKRYQLLLEEKWVGILSNALAVLITSTGVPIFNLAIGPISWAREKILSRWGREHQDPIDQTSGFLDLTGVELRTLYQMRPAAVQLPTRNPRSVFKQQMRRDICGSLMVLMIAMALPIAIIIASILSSGLATDSIGLSNSANYGKYIYRSSLSSGSPQSLEFEHRSESQAAAYASDFYDNSPRVQEYPSRFYNRSISYEVHKNATCPFAGDVCVGGENKPYRLATGLVPASVLGINTATSFHFRRTMTCSPIIKNYKYLRSGRSKQGIDQWEYWYGSSSGRYTFANPIAKSTWPIMGYSMSTHCSDAVSDSSLFKPLPELKAGYFPVTLLFLSSHGILYTKNRTDPLFPAETLARFLPEYTGPPQYYQNSTQAGILGCVDEFQICKSITGPCWDNSNATSIIKSSPDHETTTDETVATLLLLSLDLSTACGSIQFRGAEALDAQSKVADMHSLVLSHRQ